MGFEDYDAYLRSSLWADTRASYWQNPDSSKSCGLCGTSDPPLALHHRTYARVGKECLDDLIAICGTCHALIHAIEARGDIELDSDLAELVDAVRAASYRRTLRPHEKPDPRPEYEVERKKLINHLSNIRSELAKARRLGKPEARIIRVQERLGRYETRLAELERNPGQVFDPLSLDYRHRYGTRTRTL